MFRKVAEKQLKIPFPKHADIQAVINTPDLEGVPQAVREVAIILGPGAGGDLSSGHLPTTAESLASRGFTCVRYSMKPPNMALRVKCVQVHRPSSPSGSRLHTQALPPTLDVWYRLDVCGS